MTTATGEQPTSLGWTAGPDTFGARLALVRQRMGWNIKEAARECGLGAESWRLWEQGREPSRIVTVCMSIATRTGCDYLWLVHGPDRGEIRPKTYVDPAPISLNGRSVREGRVVATISHLPNESGATDTTRTVRQTRPLIGVPRPRTALSAPVRGMADVLAA